MEYRQKNPTILTASCLAKQLSKMGAYDNVNNKILRNGIPDFALKDLDLGDVGAFYEPLTHSAIVGVRGDNELSVGLYAHSLSRYPNAKNYTGKIGSFFRLSSNNYILFHIPDVPVITKIELVEINPKDGSTTDFYYRAILDDTKNGGDGQIERSAADIKPVILSKDSNIQLRIYFNHPININYNNAGENHYVKLVQVEPMLILGLPGVTFKETVSIDVVNPKLEDNNKKLIYQLPVEEIKKRDANLKWFIKIRAFSESDDTPLNGSGTYAEYKDEPDLNHWFYARIPQLTVNSSEISKLHLPLIKSGPPPKAFNPQPLASDGFIVYPVEEYERFAPCYSTLPNNFSSASCIMNVTQQISSEYMPSFYLNKELIESGTAEEPKKTIEELPDGDTGITNLKKANYPSFVANLKTEASGKKDKQNQWDMRCQVLLFE